MTGITFSPYDYRIHEDPFPTYARLRDAAPLYRNEEFDFWALSRHADVVAAFRNLEVFSNANGVSLDPSAYGPHAHRTMSLLATDPPLHTRLRSIVSRTFTPRRIAALEPRVRAITLEYLEPALEGGSFDLIDDIAGKVPMDVISDLVGVPHADRAELRRLADLLIHREEGTFDVTPEGFEAAIALFGYYDELMRERRATPRDDLTSELLAADEGGDRLTDDEIAAFLFLLVVAGNETTTKLLGNAWYWAWANPDERAKVFADRERIHDWVEETLRYDGSTQMVLRTVKSPIELHGTELGVGERVFLLIGSANRDERVFDRPDDYDLDRVTSDLLAFGSGRHFCLGALLARLETRAVLDELLARVTDYDIDATRAQRVHSANVRGFAHLPTTVVTR
ncbi:MAG: cytochrome P450 [Actinomycetes bacterium]